MKKTLFLILTLFLVVGACQKGHDDLSHGTITGTDPKMCECCGGWFIHIGQNTYRFYSLPPGSHLDLNHATFPIPVELKWEPSPNPCLGDEIIITQIEIE